MQSMPPDVLARIKSEAAVAAGHTNRDNFAALFDDLSSLPAIAATRVDPMLRWLPVSQARITVWTRIRIWLGSDDRVPAQKLWVLLGDRDGRLREAALRALDGRRVPAPFWVMMLALRMNDWVEPVRRAALLCAERSFAATSGETLAAAAGPLLALRNAWGRWNDDARSVVDAVIVRPDVVSEITCLLIAARNGPAGVTLRRALLEQAYDGQLAAIAKHAALPDVRRAALEALIYQRVRIRSHTERVWVDKSMGRFSSEWRYLTRPLRGPIPAEEALELAAADRSAMVRRVAVVALLMPDLFLANRDAVLDRLVKDKNPVLRRRARYAIENETGVAIQNGDARL